ncbi:hypothetical protein TNCV_579061 [Trichonephila clavipes]|nr:hypothetical protein TNCV_579061 [Trichonephila clavipes]
MTTDLTPHSPDFCIVPMHESLYAVGLLWPSSLYFGHLLHRQSGIIIQAKGGSQSVESVSAEVCEIVCHAQLFVMDYRLYETLTA